jgi:hypothetical protein
MADWREQVRNVYEPREKEKKLKNVIILHGDTVEFKTYGNYMNPVCDMYQAVIAEYEKYFDIIAYYTDNDGDRRKKGLNFYKGKELFLSLCDKPPEPSTLPAVPAAAAGNNYIKNRYNRYNRSYVTSVEEGKQDRLSREATYYESDPNQMIEHLDRNLFSINEHKALIIFDDWLYWNNRLFFKDPDYQLQPNTDTLNIFRRWTKGDTLSKHQHLIFVITLQNPMRRDRQYQPRSRTEETVRSIFNPSPNCIGIPVAPLAEDTVRDAMLGAHFKTTLSFRLSVETEAEKMAALLHENKIIARDGLKIIHDLAAMGGTWDADRLCKEMNLQPLSKIKPIEEMNETEITARMKDYVVGQDDALSIIAKEIRNAVRSKAPHKGPIEKFMLVGPTGVGKTETAKALAYALTGNADDFIYFSANEYPGEESVWSAFGPTPGYRGYRDEMQQTGGGMLTRPLIQNPNKRFIILIDEIEKTSETFHNAIYTLLAEGMADDRSAQRKVSFRNCIIISTSNFADREIAAYMADRPSMRDAQLECRRIMSRSGMKPAFISRWTLIPYAYPPQDALRQILVKHINFWIQNEEKDIGRIDNRYLSSVLKKHADLPAGIRGIIDEVKVDLFDQILDCQPRTPYIIDPKGRIISE